MMADYLEAPNHPPFTGLANPWVFLGGGITGCPDWQQEIRALLEDEWLTLVNPRRENFPIDDPEAAPAQIKWEHQYLERCRAIIFWFPCETLCPIALYELGKWTMKSKDEAFRGRDKPLFIGTHPEYKRRQDVIIQTGLELPNQVIHDSVAGVAEEVKEWAARQ